MAYTQEQLITALRKADAAQDLLAVNELTGMLEALEPKPPVEGYDPSAFTSPEQYRKTLGAMSETVSDLPVFAKELRQEFDDPADPEAAWALATTKRGVLGTGLELLGQGAKLSLMALSEHTPDSVEKKIVDTLTPVAKVVADSPIGDFASWSWDEYMEWKNDNPRKGRALEGVVNVAELFVPPLRRTPVTDDRSLVRTLADEQYGRAVELETGKRRDFLNTVITPIETKANNEKRAARMTQDEKGRNIYQPTDDEIEMVNVLSRIDEIDQKQSFVKIREILEKQVKTTHDNLNNLLKKSKFKFNTKKLVKKMEAQVAKQLDENPVLVGDAGKVATKIFNRAVRLLAETDGSPAAVMDVRRQLDDWAKKQGKSSYDGNENAYTVAQRSVRDFLNDAVSEAVPETAVLEKLRRQHLLLRAKDRVLPKSAVEADTKLGRSLQNIMKATDTTVSKTALGKIGTVSVAASVLGGAAFLNILPTLTALAATGTLGYAVYRGSVSPTLRKTLSKGLREIDDVLSKKSLGNEMRKALQADRAVFIELMKLPTAPEGADEEQEETVK
jgi:hypothetical protein